MLRGIERGRHQSSRPLYRTIRGRYSRHPVKDGDGYTGGTAFERNVRADPVKKGTRCYTIGNSAEVLPKSWRQNCALKHRSESDELELNCPYRFASPWFCERLLFSTFMFLFFANRHQHSRYVNNSITRSVSTHLLSSPQR